jgi:hypothetical protein
LIAHEIEAELLRRQERTADKIAANTKENKKAIPATTKEPVKPPPQIPTEKMATDFFGRLVTKPSEMEDADSVAGNNCWERIQIILNYSSCYYKQLVISKEQKYGIDTTKDFQTRCDSHSRSNIFCSVFAQL